MSERKQEVINRIGIIAETIQVIDQNNLKRELAFFKWVLQEILSKLERVDAIELEINPETIENVKKIALLNLERRNYQSFFDRAKIDLDDIIDADDTLWSFFNLIFEIKSPDEETNDSNIDDD